MAEVTLKQLYQEIQILHEDLEMLKRTLVPEEKVSETELHELRRIRREMEAGREKRLEEIFPSA